MLIYSIADSMSMAMRLQVDSSVHALMQTIVLVLFSPVASQVKCLPDPKDL